MKYTKTLLLIIFTLGLLGFIAIFLTPSYSFAAEANFTPQVSIGEFIAGNSVPVATDARTIWNYIRAIYKYAIGVVGIVAAVVLMVGGIMWLTAGGNQTRIGEAKAYITASLTGLLLALTSFLILATVNPRLVEFNPIKVSEVISNTKGCCSFPVGSNNSCREATESECKNLSESAIWKLGYGCDTNGNCILDCKGSGGTCAKYLGGMTGQCPWGYMKDNYLCEQGTCCIGYNKPVYTYDSCLNKDAVCYDNSDCCSNSCPGVTGRKCD